MGAAFDILGITGQSFDAIALAGRQTKYREGWRIGVWCGWRGSNPRPLASEANTLSTELQPRLIHC